MRDIADDSLRNRNVCLIIVQTWLVGIVYYGGSEFSDFRKDPVVDIRSLLYTSLPAECPRLQHTAVRCFAFTAGPLPSHHNHDFGICNQVDWSCSEFFPAWILRLDSRPGGSGLFRSDNHDRCHRRMSLDPRSGDWSDPSKQ